MPVKASPRVPGAKPILTSISTCCLDIMASNYEGGLCVLLVNCQPSPLAQCPDDKFPAYTRGRRPSTPSPLGEAPGDTKRPSGYAPRPQFPIRSRPPQWLVENIDESVGNTLLRDQLQLLLHTQPSFLLVPTRSFFALYSPKREARQGSEFSLEQRGG